MRMSKLALWAGLAGAVATSPALATFHLMQIHQVIAGVDGDTSAQAIQLRMRFSGQNLVSASRIRVHDAAGLNPITIIDIGTNVANGAGGDTVLIVSPNFMNYTDPTVVPDFTMTNLIPDSYLAAGSLTFESDAGTVYWRLSWGGASYTGSCGCNAINDPNSNACPAYSGVLPSSGVEALQFLGTFGATSNNNDADYALTSGAAAFTNNAHETFTVTAGDVPISIVSSEPADGSIDARQPSNPDGSSPAGWDEVTLTFDGDTSELTAADFEVTEEGGDGLPPTIVDVGIGDLIAIVSFDTFIEAGAWTTITHIESDTSVTLGNLPGDANGDGTTAATDLLAIIDSLNGVNVLPPHGADIDRSGLAGAPDVLREVDLLNGAGVYDPWLGVALP